MHSKIRSMITYHPSKKRNRTYTRLSLEERFWKYVQKGPDCWIWTSKSRANFGYGVINLGGRNGKIERAHRVSWMLHNGAIPDGIFVLHRCDVPLCVNPDHLFLGTRDDNNKDMSKKGRARGPSFNRAEHPMTKLSDSDVSKIRELHTKLKSNRLLFHHSPIRQIANEYGVAFQTIWKIVNRSHLSK